MNMNSLKEKVGHIVSAALTVTEISAEEWSSMISGDAEIYPGTFRRSNRLAWLWERGSAAVQILECDCTDLTEREALLIELLISEARAGNKQTSGKRDEESRSVQVGEWIQERLEQKDLRRSLPDRFVLKSRLQFPILPFLLRWENRTAQDIPFSKLYKLLRSYFGGELVLVPLKEGWLILVNEGLLADLREEREEGPGAQRDLLGALCEGLHELITNEWGGGGCHLAVNELIKSDDEIAVAASSLQETLAIGHLFRVAEHIHLPWELHLERLVSNIPVEERQKFLVEMGGHTDILSDEEMLVTLETFFQMDCNVSETAKRLYIHRNTLMYRIDKIKQETGLDVRTFRDAVLMNLKLLLYKVTKRV